MSEIKNVRQIWMALNTLKCTHLTPLRFKGLSRHTRLAGNKCSNTNTGLCMKPAEWQCVHDRVATHLTGPASLAVQTGTYQPQSY